MMATSSFFGVARRMYFSVGLRESFWNLTQDRKEEVGILIPDLIFWAEFFVYNYLGQEF